VTKEKIALLHEKMCNLCEVQDAKGTEVRCKHLEKENSDLKQKLSREKIS